MGRYGGVRPTPPIFFFTPAIPGEPQKFFSLNEVNLAVKEKLEQLNNKVMQSVGRSRRQEFEEIDRPNLRPLPEKPYVYAREKLPR